MCWFIGGDDRARWTVEFLRRNGLRVETYGVPREENTPLPDFFPLLLLPFPMGDMGGLTERITERVREGSLIIGGGLEKLREPLERSGARVVDLYHSEPLTTLNGVATVEGALALLIGASEITLWESDCLVIGAGRIGMLLGERLRNLGARVTLWARNPKDLAMIRSRAMVPEVTGRYEKTLGKYDFVINTVPATVLEKDHLEQLKKSCVIMELASAPGGFSAEGCEALGLKTIRAPGLPGKFSPKTAGILYGEAILGTLKEEGIL